MEDNKSLLIMLGIILVVMNLIGYVVINGNAQEIDVDKLRSDIVAQVNANIDIPSAEEIVAGITIPEVVIPEAKEVNSERIDDLWEDMYADEIEELEAEAYDVAVEELENKDYKLLVKYLEATIVGFDELKNVDIEDSEITIVELGLEEDDDKIADVALELKIKYILEEGEVGRIKLNVDANANVVFDEGDYTDEDCELVFA